MEGDVASEEVFECKLTKIIDEEEATKPNTEFKLGRIAWKIVAEQMYFAKPTKQMANHLRPLFITTNLGGIPISKVMVGGGAAVNHIGWWSN